MIKDKKPYLKFKLALAATLLTALAFVFLFYYIGINQRVNTYNDSKHLAKEISQNAAKETEIYLSSAIMTARSLAQRSLIYRELGANREKLVEMSKSTLNRNKNIMGVWTMWEPNAFDGLDKKFSTSSFYDSLGSMSFCFFRINDSTRFERNHPDDVYQPFYKLPKEFGTELILDPFFYQYHGDTNTVYQTSAVVPIKSGNTFLGVYGVDIQIDSLADKLNQIRLFKTGYLSLITNSGVIVTHRNQRFMSQLVYNQLVDPDSLIYNAITTGKQHTMEVVSEFTGEKVFRFFHPIKIGVENKPWTMMVEIPINEATTRSRQLLFIALGTIVFGISLVIYLIFSLIDRVGYEKTLKLALHENKLSSKIIADSERNYKEIFNSTSEAIFIHETVSGKIIDINNVVLEMYGFDVKNEVLSKTVDDLSKGQAPYTLEQARQFSIKTLTEGPQVFEWLSKKKNGETFWTEVSLKSVQLNGEARILAVIRNINDRKKLELNLRESEEKYKTLIENSKDGIAILDIDGNIVFTNRRHKHMFGEINSTNYTGKPIFRYFTRKSRVSFYKKYPDLIQEGHIDGFFAEAIRSDGEIFPTELNISVINEPLESDIRLMLTIRDISKRIKAEKALKESEEKYRNLMENLNEVVMMVDNDDKVLFVNRKFTETFGFQPEEIIGEIGYKKLLDPKDHETIIQANQLRKKNESSQYEITFKSKSGNPIHLLVNGSPMCNSDGEIVGSIGTMTDITTIKKAERALKESEEKYRGLMENMSEAVIMVDNDDRVLYINRQFTQTLGYLPDEIIGKIGYEILLKAHDQHRIIEANVDRINKKTTQYEASLISKNGSAHDFLISGSPVIDANGKVIGSIAAMTDITERKKAEKALIESEDRYRRLIDAFPDIIMVSDMQGNILFANKQLETFTGIKPEDFQNPNRKAHIHPDDIKMLLEARSDLLNSEKQYTDIIENRFIDAKGTEHWFSGIMAKIMFNGQLAIQTISRDITEKKKIEQELFHYQNHLEFLVKERTEELNQHIEELNTTRDSLEKRNQQLNQLQSELLNEKKLVDYLMDTIPDAIYFKDLDSRFLKASKSIQASFSKILKSDFSGKTDFDFFAEEYAKKTLEQEKQIISTGKPVIEQVEQEKWKDGRVNYISVTKMPLRNSNGEIIGTFGVSRDITKLIEMEASIKQQNEELIAQREELEATLNNLQQAQNQLIHAEKMASLGVLSAGVAHEINNPLNFISAGIHGIESYITDNLSEHATQLSAMLNAIHTGVNRAAAIVSSLNHYSRRDDLPRTDCDINSIIDNCLIMLHNQLKHKVEIVKNFTNSTCTVYGSEGKLHQAILNIIANSSQAIKDKGQISITTSIESKKIVIRIVDNGSGISPEILPKILDPFFTTKEPGKGTGLGLSITYNIIQEHNGNIEFRSELNKGTTAIISLPCKNSNS